MVKFVLPVFIMLMVGCKESINKAQWNSSQNKFVSGEHFFQFFLESKSPYAIEQKEYISQIKTALLCLKGAKKNLLVFIIGSSRDSSKEIPMTYGDPHSKEMPMEFGNSFPSSGGTSMTYSEPASESYPGYACYEATLARMVQGKEHFFDFSINSSGISFGRVEI